MNTLPQLPQRFRQGEVLTADKLNKLLDWTEAVARALPGLEVRTASGSGLTYSHSSTGTVISLARGFAKGAGTQAAGEHVHPFKLSASWENFEARELRVRVALGHVMSSHGGSLVQPFALGADRSIDVQRFHDEEHGGFFDVGLFLYYFSTGKHIRPYQRTQFAELVASPADAPIHLGGTPFPDPPPEGEIRVPTCITIGTIEWDELGNLTIRQRWRSDVIPYSYH